MTGERLSYDRDTQGLTLHNTITDPHRQHRVNVERVDAPEDLLEIVDDTLDRSATQGWCGGG